MTQIVATVAPHEAPEDHAAGRVVLVSADGADVDSSPVGIKTRGSGLDIDITIDRSTVLRGVGRMAAVEVRGPRGERYFANDFTLTLMPGDEVIVSPGW